MPPPTGQDRERSQPQVVYDVDDRPPLREGIPLGFQHLVAMLPGNVTPPLLIAGGLAPTTGETTFLLQMALVMAGIATLVQAYPVGPVGGRIPIVMGTSIAFVGGAIAGPTRSGTSPKASGRSSAPA